MQILKKRSTKEPFDHNNCLGIADYKSYIDDANDLLSGQTQNDIIFRNLDIDLVTNPSGATMTQTIVEEEINGIMAYSYQYVMQFIAPRSSYYRFEVRADNNPAHVCFNHYKLINWHVNISTPGKGSVGCFGDEASSTLFAVDTLFVKEKQYMNFHFLYSRYPDIDFDKDTFIWTPEQLLNGYNEENANGKWVQLRFMILGCSQKVA